MVFQNAFSFFKNASPADLLTNVVNKSEAAVFVNNDLPLRTEISDFCTHAKIRFAEIFIAFYVASSFLKSSVVNKYRIDKMSLKKKQVINPKAKFN